MLTEDGKHLYVSYDEYHNLIEKLALKIHQSGWQFDTILCLARGGLRPGDILSRIFDKPLAIMSTSSYRAEAGTVQGHLDIARYITTPKGGGHGAVHHLQPGGDDAGGDDVGHRVAGLLERIERREDDARELEFLVQNHLVMSHLAQRRDIHDDKLFAGTYGAVTKPDDVARLKRLGWREREGSWCIGT